MDVVAVVEQFGVPTVNGAVTVVAVLMFVSLFL